MRQLATILLVVALSVPANAQEPKGAQLFRQNWTSAETTTDGLGPLYNEASCHACHWYGGGARVRIRPNGEVAGAGVLLRHTFVDGRPDPYYGYQLQNKAVRGGRPEGVADLSAVQVAGDLTRFLASVRFASGPGRTAGITMSLRAAPALDATALVSSISDAAILKLADPDDSDNDGISGRVHLLGEGNVQAVGRFNWKATMARVEDQIAAALWFDMGLTSSARRNPQGECTRRQMDCLEASGSQAADLPLDAGDDQVAAMSDFVRALGKLAATPVPDMPSAFSDAGCASCHVPEMTANNGRKVPIFSDLLLHDMGEGLTSYGGEGGASPTEWRTTPLIGFRGAIPDHRYLHDGRAANIDEAIRWHSGEAEASRNAYMALSVIERLELTSYVQSLLTAMSLPPQGD
jgi:CxxC motif-containing protein (DUF1111 family)